MEVLVLSQKQEINSQLQYEETESFTLIKNIILLSPGNWNGYTFKKEEIEKAFQKTDWSNKQNFALIYDHDERATNWLGNVRNIKILSDGSLVGDLEIFDKQVAVKLTKGGAKLGISAKVLGVENESGEFVNFTFNNFSLVYDPACKTAYVNLSEQKLLKRVEELEKKVKELEGETGVEATRGSEVKSNVNTKIKYGKKKEEELGPKFDEAIGKIKDSLKKKYPKWDDKKITSTAYAIATKNKIPRNLHEELSETELEEISKEFSDLQDLKGGLNSVKMEEKTTQIEETPETPEVTPEVTPEETKEEVKEEAKEPEAKAEEPEAETETKSEESTEAPKEATEELSSKLDKVLNLLESFDKRIAKLENTKVEKLSSKAEPKVMSVAKLSNQTVNPLLGRQYSEGEMRLAEAILKNAKQC